MTFTLNGISQDRIILTSGDTIHCSINKVKKKYVFYSQDFNGATAKGKVLKDSVREWSYFGAKENQVVERAILSPDIPTKDSESEVDLVEKREENGKFRITLNAGPGYLLGNTKGAVQSLQAQGVSSGDSKEYYDNLKLGAQTKASLFFHAWGDYWFGAMYNGFYSASELITTMYLDDVNMYYGKIGEHYFVNFAGASFYSAGRYGNKKQIGLNSSFSVGPAFYRDEAEMLNKQILIQGVSLATNVTLGIEYFFQPRWSINLETAFFTSNLKKLKVTSIQSTQEVELDKENYENLSRLELSLGIVYYW